VHAGETHLDPEVQRRLVESVIAPASEPVSSVLPDGLTAREIEVLTLIAEGLSNHEIAARLVVSVATVKTHVNRIFAKTGARDRAQAVMYAYRHGLVG
jgi:DNA-binding NarL/FixJ family response regulator